jgi:hypothetical protein
MAMPIAGTWRSGADTSCVGIGGARIVLRSQMVFHRTLVYIKLATRVLAVLIYMTMGVPLQSSSTY